MVTEEVVVKMEETIPALVDAAHAHLRKTALLQSSIAQALSAMKRLSGAHKAHDERHRAEALGDAEREVANLREVFREVALRQAMLEQAIAETDHAARVWFHRERGVR